MSFGKKILFSIFIFMVFFSLLELGLYFFCFRHKLLRDQSARYFEMTPHMDEVNQGIRFRINSAGWRDGEVPVKKAGEIYIFCLGDSSTFGWMVREEETYPRKLEKRLKKFTPHVRVINAGTPGYTTDHQLYFLEKKIFPYSPDLVILKAGHNERRLVYDNSNKAEKDQGIAGWLTLFIRQLNTYNFLMGLRRRNLPVSKPPTVPKVSADAMVEDLKKMNELCKKKSIPFVLLYWGLNKDAVQDKEKAKKYIAVKEFDKAIFHLQRCLAVDVNWDFELYEMLAFCFTAKGDEERAKECREKAGKWYLLYGVFMDDSAYLEKIRSLEKDPNFHLIVIEDNLLTHKYLRDMVHPTPEFNEYLSSRITDYLIENKLFLMN